MTIYLNTEAVQDALRVPKMVWKQRDGWPDGYKQTTNDTKPLYKSFFIGKYRILVYSGDADVGLPLRYSEDWVHKLGLAVKEPWRPWTLDGARQTAGFVSRCAADNWSEVSAGAFIPSCPQNKDEFYGMRALKKAITNGGQGRRAVLMVAIPSNTV